MPSKPFSSKLALQIVIVIIFLVAVFEVILRSIYYIDYGKEKLAIGEFGKSVRENYFEDPFGKINFNAHSVARPDSTEEVNRAIAKEAARSNIIEYVPWVELKMIDHAGKYVNSSGFKRKSEPEASDNDTAQPIKIFFFGGSTMYGYNLTDQETIPSAFVRLYKEKFPTGRSIQVANYGIPYYYSYSELMLFTYLINIGEMPDIIIFLDGLNDVFQSRASVERLPLNYYHNKAGSSQNLTLKQIRKSLDSSYSLYQVPKGVSTVSYSNLILKNYSDNILQIQKLAAINGIKPFFFVQPTPFYNYPNRKNDRICNQDTIELFGIWYPQVQKVAEQAGIFYLGNMLEEEKGSPFIDRFHYSPMMTKKIADSILQKVQPFVQ